METQRAAEGGDAESSWGWTHRVSSAAAPDYSILTRFTSIRVSAKYQGLKLEYREQRHAALDLLGRIRNKLQLWKRSYTSAEAVRVLLQEWHVSGPAGGAGGVCLVGFLCV